MWKLILYNTLTRKKEEFKPLENNTVKMYTCWPTVYNYAHIWNLRAYIFADLLKRTLIFAWYNVKHIINFTDVWHLTDDADAGEDKMEKASQREWKTAWEISAFYAEQFKQDIKKLNIIFPDKFIKATDYIQQQIDLIKVLEKKWYTYKIEDGIYMDTSKVKDYWKLMGPEWKKHFEWLEAGKRIDIKGKKNKTDFALWKFSPKDKKRQMEWDSPWWKWFPGWHIECSAMNLSEFGETVDIHTWWVDHIPVHHTNEIAQSECATWKQFVRFWLHSEFLILKDDKMSKSKWNFIRLQTVIDRWISPIGYRFFVLQSHYRKQLIFSWQLLEQAYENYKNLKKHIQKSISNNNLIDKNQYNKYFDLLKDALFDDLNTPKTLWIFWSMLKDKKVNWATKKALVEKFDQVFGLNLLDFSDIQPKKSKIPEDIKKLAQIRWEYKKKKDFEKADKIREEILQKWYRIIDQKDGYVIEKG